MNMSSNPIWNWIVPSVLGKTNVDSSTIPGNPDQEKGFGLFLLHSLVLTNGTTMNSNWLLLGTEFYFKCINAMFISYTDGVRKFQTELAKNQKA